MRDTLAVVFLVLNLAALGALSTTTATFSVPTAAVLLPALTVGHLVGRSVAGWMAPLTLQRLTSVLLVASAFASIATGLNSL